MIETSHIYASEGHADTDTEETFRISRVAAGLSGGSVELSPDAQGGLFSEALNLYFRWEDQLDTHVRLLRPYLPDGTPITTSMEEHRLRLEAEARATEEAQRRQEVEIELECLRQQLANR